ncbi:hypothetical protein G6F22_010236 [Rhizopus arrhizus]|nr:hypothetical protein G6F22_010236 [Rhizopus arrhizus]
MLLTLFSLAWFNKKRILKFEDKILEACTRLNATENIRGINFRFTKNGSDITRPFQSFYPYVTNYAIDIELDDRFNALKSRQLNQSGIRSVFFPYEQEVVNMFQDPPPPWSAPFSEKSVYLV